MLSAEFFLGLGVGDFFQGCAAEGGAGADEDVGVGGGFFGAVGECDVEDGGGEVGVVVEVSEHLCGGTGVGVGVIIEEEEELALGLAHGDIFGDGADVFG